MNQQERRAYLIRSLLDETAQYRHMAVPGKTDEQRQLLRALFNIRMPRETDPEFLRIQDEYLQRENEARGVTDYKTLTPREPGIYLWQGDITTLRCDAIVNAANSQMLGCFRPNHNCIDNCIHTYAGVQLRAACQELMEQQGHEEETGKAKITPAYNLPSRYVLHTVGPIVEGRLTPRHEELLASCYRSCLEVAEQQGLHSVAFCCISTGVFMFPADRAAEIALQTVRDYLKTHPGHMDVIFNVFSAQDYARYDRLLG